MHRLALGDEIELVSVCAPSGSHPAPTDIVWFSHVHEIDGPRVTLVVRTGGGAEMVLQANAADIRRLDSGEWQVTLPMNHRLMEAAEA